MNMQTLQQSRHCTLTVQLAFDEMHLQEFVAAGNWLVNGHCNKEAKFLRR